MLLRRVLQDSWLTQSLYRSYVSVVTINAKALQSIKIKPQDLFATSSSEVDLVILDERNNKVDVANLETFKVVRTKEEFTIDCNEPERYSVVIDIPLHVSPEVKVEIVAENSKVSVEDIPTKHVDIRVKSGDISFKNIRGQTIRAETDKGDISTKGTLLAHKIELISKNGRVEIAKSQGEEIEVDAVSIKIGSCYNNKSKFTTTNDAILKNIHGISTMKASGNRFKLTGFQGILQADLNNKDVEIQISELGRHSNITSRGNAVVKLGLSESVLTTTNFKISSNCSIDSFTDEVMVCQKKKNLFEVKKELSKIGVVLNVNVTNAKHMEIRKMSWIDFIKVVS